MKAYWIGLSARALGAAAALVGICGGVPEIWAQGCVAVRGASLCGVGFPLDATRPGLHMPGGGWQVGVGYRWLHSDRHFRGAHEEEFRQEQGTEVINDSHFVDVGISYAFDERFSAGVVIPFVYSDRSSLYEHKGNASGERYHTEAGGLADIRAAAYAWVWNPGGAPRGNVQFGVGFKAPTGAEDATDLFMRPAGPTLDYVDQSIQPGDGGWGLTVEFYAWRELVPRLTGYLQGYYLVNPQNINGVPTRIANLNNPDPDTRMSIPDQYLARGGLSYAVAPHWGLAISLGGRVEGVPVRDLIGESDGFRRPGFAVSIEPGLSWMRGGWAATVTAPVALYRNREQSVPDMRRGRHGDAAFADFTVQASVSRRF